MCRPYRLTFILLAESGMRADEVLSLDVDDVCLDASREGLCLRETRNHHERTVVLIANHMPRSLRGLRSHLRGQDRSLPGVAAVSLAAWHTGEHEITGHDELLAIQMIEETMVHFLVKSLKNATKSFDLRSLFYSRKVWL